MFFKKAAAGDLQTRELKNTFLSEPLYTAKNNFTFCRGNVNQLYLQFNEPLIDFAATRNAHRSNKKTDQGNSASAKEKEYRLSCSSKGGQRNLHDRLFG